MKRIFICYDTILIHPLPIARLLYLNIWIPMPIRPNPIIPHSISRLLQLSLGLRLLQDGVQLGRLHDIALDLELARHE